MNTQQTQNDVTDTKAQETLDPAGVGELATQVVINSSGHAKTKLETEHLDFKGTDILRLRGGGDSSEEDDGTNDKTSGGMVIEESTSGTSGKRGATSPIKASEVKKSKPTEVAKLSKEINT